ncbi:putative 26S proteasome regulatory subunit [Tulasnella sp. 425]|nr:putative 26S proteasome regulatory subunit [Tulasnella sp. 425]
MGRPIPRSPHGEPEPTPRQIAMNLMSRKDAIEKEIKEQQTLLDSNNSTMTTELVDNEGFPRGDIDVYTVRHARVRIIELRNDLKAVTDELAIALQDVFNSPEPEPSAAESATNGQEQSEALKEFARVDGVAPGSPANEAGLLREDLILRFGGLTAASFSGNSLQPLATMVASQENRQMTVRVRRGGEEVDLSFTPRKWAGRGLLG